MAEKGVCIHILNNGDEIANCKYSGLTKISDCLIEADAILYNYNKYLIDKDMPLDILAIKMLQKENVDGTRKLSDPFILYFSKLRLSFKYPDYDLHYKKGNESHGVIAFTEQDRRNNVENIKRNIYIDISTKEIIIENFYYQECANDYFDKHPIPKTIYDELKRSDRIFVMFNFNELEEVMEWFKEINHRGMWLSTDLDCVYLTIT